MAARRPARATARWACLGVLEVGFRLPGGAALPVQLDLWADDTIHLQRNGLPGDELAVDEIGRWRSLGGDRAMSHASLSNQYWRVDRLNGQRVTPLAESPGDVFVILRGDQGGYVANAGCGRFAGSYQVTGTSIAFDAPAKLPDCSGALGDRQQTLLDALAAVRTWVIQGQVLELFDATGRSLAALEAVYLR